MEYTFGNERLDGPLALGLHVRGSFYDILDTEDCRIVDGDFRMLRNAVREYFAGKGVPFYHRSRKDGILRYLIVRKARFSGESLTVLVTAPGYVPEPDFVPMLRALPLSGRLAGIWHGITDSVADTAYCSDVRLLDGKEYITEHLLGLSFRITPYSFFQTNSAGAEVLYSRVREYAGSARCRRIYDLYCGTGTITQLLAGSADEVIGVEIVGEAVEAAKRNAVENGLDNCRFLCGDVLKTLDSLESDADLVILDPPREGVHAKALAKIAGDFAPERIVYVSCKATSLVRDLELLTAYGYRPVRGCCVDMFPRTGHVETVVLLSRGSDGEHSRVYVHPSGLE